MTTGSDAGAKEWQILLRASYNLSKARMLYKELFGAAHDSKDIGQEFCNLVDEAIAEDEGKVEVPIQIALALYLRPRMGRGPGNRGKPLWHKRQQKLLERLVLERKAELKATMLPREADNQIIDEFHERIGIFKPAFGIDQMEPFGITENMIWRWLGHHE